MSKLKNKIIKATKTGGIYKLYYKSYFKNKNQVSHTTIHNISYILIKVKEIKRLILS